MMLHIDLPVQEVSLYCEWYWNKRTKNIPCFGFNAAVEKDEHTQFSTVQKYGSGTLPK